MGAAWSGWDFYCLATLVAWLGVVLNWVNPGTTRFMEIRLDELRVKPGGAA